MTSASADEAQGAIGGGQIAAAVMGNALEFYDFSTYALFATQIGASFFPAHSPDKTFVTLLTFGIGFGSRPLGAAILGLIGDRVGRRPSMLISFTLMGLGLIGLILIPPYAVIGAAAPALLLLCRLVQGFALGGEVGPTTALLIEAAPPERRALIGSWQSASQGVATLVGAVVAYALAHSMTPEALQSYGWRIAFGIGAVVLPFGLILRRRLPETLHRSDTATAAREVTALRDLIRPALIGLGMIMSFTTSTYVLLYMTTYATETLHISIKDSFGPSVANGLSSIFFALLGGWLADRFGRKVVMMTARTLLLLITWPVFALIVHNHDVLTLTIGTGLISACSSTSVGVALVALTESLQKNVRSTAMALIYAVGVSAFGAAALPLINKVITVTHNPMAPAWYLILTAAIGITAMGFLRETHPKKATAMPGVEFA